MKMWDRNSLVDRFKYIITRQNWVKYVAGRWSSEIFLTRRFLEK